MATMQTTYSLIDLTVVFSRRILNTFFFQVLFWGVREMKRINLTTVDRPQVDIDLAGHVIQSTVIANAKKNPNFQNPVIFFDVVRKWISINVT